MIDVDDSEAVADEWQAGLQRIGRFVEQFLRSHPDGERQLLEWLESVPEERTDAEYKQACEQHLLTKFDDLPPGAGKVAHLVCRFLCTHWDGARLLREWSDSMNPVKPAGQDVGPTPAQQRMAMRVTRHLADIIQMHRAGTSAQEIAAKLEIEEYLVQQVIDIGRRKWERMT